MNNPNKIDTFYETFNSSRCKTAMLIISMIVFAAVVYCETVGQQSNFLNNVAILIIGYWTGRTTKTNDPN